MKTISSTLHYPHESEHVRKRVTLSERTVLPLLSGEYLPYRAKADDVSHSWVEPSSSEVQYTAPVRVAKASRRKRLGRMRKSKKRSKKCIRKYAHIVFLRSNLELVVVERPRLRQFLPRRRCAENRC